MKNIEKQLAATYEQVSGKAITFIVIVVTHNRRLSVRAKTERVFNVGFSVTAVILQRLVVLFLIPKFKNDRCYKQSKSDSINCCHVNVAVM